jgi:hypothetical protein
MALVLLLCGYHDDRMDVHVWGHINETQKSELTTLQFFDVGGFLVSS